MRRRIRGVGSRLGGMRDPSRLLMSVKAALAVTIAWLLAPLLPFAEDEYSYYAPLGVLVSMYPTIVGSARSGMQSLLGLSVGIGLGLLGTAAGVIGLPAVIALAVIVGAGVVLGGIRGLGAGRDWIAIAALFVLLASGGSTGEYSLSYLVDVAFGVVVGLLVNLIVVPPLYLGRASTRLTELRNAVVALMEAMSRSVAQGRMEPEELRAASDEVARTAADVHATVQEADESRRANPRAPRHRHEQEENLIRLESLERAAFYARDLADVLVRIPPDDNVLLGPDVRDGFSHAIRTAAAVVAAPADADPDGEAAASARAAAAGTLQDLHDRGANGEDAAVDEIAPVALLGRIIDVSSLGRVGVQGREE